MTYDPNTDPWVLNMRRITAEIKARRQAMTETKNSPNKGETDGDTAEKVIEAPFHLNADNIVQRAEQETGRIVYDVIQDEKTLFSTLSAPLAHAWISGYNARPAKKVTEKDTDDKKEGDNPPIVDPEKEGLNKDTPPKGHLDTSKVDSKSVTATPRNRTAL